MRNRKHSHIRTICMLAIMLTLQPAFAQESNQSLVDLFREGKSSSYPERIFVHLDRNYYLTGERIWFSIYCLEMVGFKPSRASAVAYIELLNQEGQIILQKKIELIEGKGNGCFKIPETCNSEVYILRCYTSWQKNYGASHYYYNNILIIHPSRPFKQEKTRIQAESVKVDFFPEGGQLVQGVHNNIVFTVSDGNNDPLACTAEVFSDDTVVHATVSTFMPGIGKFTLVPEKGKTYHFRIPGSGNSQAKEIRIQEPVKYACALELISSPSQDRQIFIRPDQWTRDSNQHLTAVVWTGSAITMIESLVVDSVMRFDLSEEFTSAGINYLAVFDEQNKLLAERMFYVNGRNSISIEAKGLKDTYRPREAIEFALETSGSSGIPVPATSSVSVSISGSYALHFHSNSFLSSMQSGNQIPQLLLSPGDAVSDTLMDYYMIANSKGSCSWINDNPVKIDYIPEIEGLMVSGTIQHHISREAIGDLKMVLSFIDSLPDFYTTTSNEEGRFHFSLDHMKGQKDMIIQPYNIQNGLLITLDDEFTKDPLPELRFAPLTNENLPELYKQLLLNQQITEAYSIKNMVSSGRENRGQAFYGLPDQQIVMEDFIKLPIMEEVFRELSRRVFLTKDGSSYKVSILDLNTNRIIGNRPLYLLDGIPFFSSEKLLDLDPLKLNSIKFKSERYFLNDISMDGIIDIQTIGGEAGMIEFPRSAVRKYFQAFSEETYTLHPAVSAKEDPRTPIFHSTLYFNPAVSISPGKESRISFIAPDHKGKYDVVLKVLAENGGVAEKYLSFVVD